MNPVVIVVLLIAVALIAFVIGRKKQECSCGSVRIVEGIPDAIKLGISTFREFYADNPNLIGFLTPHESKVYVRAGFESRIKSRFHAEGGEVWRIGSRGEGHEYRVDSLSNLNPDTVLTAGTMLVMDKAECLLMKKGTCVDVVDQKENFLYSYKAPDDITRCCSGTGTCSYEILELTVNAYPEKDCKGTPKAEKKTFAHCHPV